MLPFSPVELRRSTSPGMIMDQDNPAALRPGTDKASRSPARPASRSAENEARIVAHLRAVLLGCGRSPVWS